MGLLDRLFRPVSPPPPPPRQHKAHFIPSDSPAIEMMRMQREIDPTKSRHDMLDMLAGEMSMRDFFYAEKGRHARRALIDKVDAGHGVTIRDMLSTVGADLEFSSADGAQVLSAHLDAMREEQKRGGRRPDSAQDAREDEARRRAASAPNVPPRPLPEWLGVPPSTILNTMAEDPELRNPAADAGTEYEAVAIAWARTVIGEGLVREEALPPAVRQWIATDHDLREDGVDEAGALQRAIEVDRISHESDRARRHMLGAVKMSALALEIEQRERRRASVPDPLDDHLHTHPRWSLWRSGQPTAVRRTRFGIDTTGSAGVDADGRGDAGGPAASERVRTTDVHRDLDRDLDPDLDVERSDDDLPPIDDAFDGDWMPSASDEPTPRQFPEPEASPPVAAAASAVARARVADPEVTASEVVLRTLATEGRPRVFIDGCPVAGTLVEMSATGLVVESEDGERRTYGGLLSREGGPAIEAPNPQDDRYFFRGAPQPLVLPPSLLADRAFRARLYAGWRRNGFPADGRTIAHALIATMPAAERMALLDALRASADAADRDWANAAQLGHGHEGLGF